MLFEGAPGIGKSRLLGAACEAAETLGVQVLRARGGELERDFSYGVVRQLFETRLASCGDDERARLFAGAAQLASPLFEFGETGGWLARGEDASQTTLHGLFWLTANLAELGPPLLLAVDDVHWCDSPSLRFLSYLARRLEGLPVAVAACVRTGEPGVDAAVLDAFESEPLATVVRPAPLSIDAVAQLLRGRLDSDPAEEFVQTVSRVLRRQSVPAQRARPRRSRGADRADRERVRTRPRARARVALSLRPAAASPPRPGGRGPCPVGRDPGRGARPGACSCARRAESGGSRRICSRARPVRRPPPSRAARLCTPGSPRRRVRRSERGGARARPRASGGAARRERCSRSTGCRPPAPRPAAGSCFGRRNLARSRAASKRRGRGRRREVVSRARAGRAS